MDDNVGELPTKLKQKGLEDNTLVIFKSDNGTTHDVGGVDQQFSNSVADLRFPLCLPYLLRNVSGTNASLSDRTAAWKALSS